MQAAKMGGEERAKWRTPQAGCLLALETSLCQIQRERGHVSVRHVLSLGELIHLTIFQSILKTAMYWYIFTGKKIYGKTESGFSRTPALQVLYTATQLSADSQAAFQPHSVCTTPVNTLIFNLQVDKSRPTVLEIKPERSSRANNVPQLGTSLVSPCRKPGLGTCKVLRLFLSYESKAHPST